MAGLRTTVSMLGAMDPRAEDISPEDNLRKAQDLTAQMPTIVAAQARLQRGFNRAQRDLQLLQKERRHQSEQPQQPLPAPQAAERVTAPYARARRNAPKAVATPTAENVSRVRPR